MAFREPDPPLCDAVVRLRRWRETDATSVYLACQDPEISHWIPAIPQPYAMTHARTFISVTGSDAWEAGVEASFAVVDPLSDRLLGAIALHAIEPRRFEIGYWVAPWARRRGVATHALRLLSRWTIREHDLVRLSLHTLDGNEASQRTALAAGFRPEGVSRNGIDGRDGPVDLVNFSLTPGDLAAHG